MATGPKVDKISFINVQKSYPPGEKLEVSYLLQNGLNVASRDWVGLFRVGWSSSRDYYTFEWAPSPVENKGLIMFAGQRLPPEDRHFYQFCFVSSDGRVRGASSPFQFSSASLDNMDDMELVEVSEDSIMIVQPKETKEKEVGVTSGLELELESVKESVSKLETENVSLLSRYEVVEHDISVKSGRLTETEEKLAEQEEKTGDLERQLQAKRESETRLMEKLERERALNHDLVTAKSSEEAGAALLSQKLVEQENVTADLKRDNEVLQLEVKEVKQKYEDLLLEVEVMKGQKESLSCEMEQIMKQNKELCAKYEEANIELSQLQEVEVDMMTQIGEKNREVEMITSNNEEVSVRHLEQIETITLERDQILQELSIAQQNIAELLGAKKDGIEINVHSNQEPPTGQEGMVDRSAYEALQQASEEIEKRLQETNENLRSRIYASQVKTEELVHRVEKCREEYESKCKELHSERQIQSGGLHQSDLAVLQVRIQEMEENQEQVTRSWEEAIQELASRKEELKMKEVKISELENEMGLIQQEFENFQDKHDQVCQTKTTKLDEQQVYMDQKVLENTELHTRVAGLTKDNGKLTHTLDQLREQLNTLKTNAKSPERSCPVCSTKFPGRISQQDYERHVDGHFQQ